MAWPRIVGLALVLSSWPVSAGADDQPPEPVLSQTGRLTLHAGYADLRVRLEIDNRGSEPAQIDAGFSVPGAVARRLALIDGSRVITGRLLPEEQAAERFEKLAGSGWSTRDPAWLRRRGPGEFALNVLPVLPGKRRVVEYDVRLPTRYERGLHRVQLRAALASSTLTLFAGDPRTRVVAFERDVRSGSVVPWVNDVEIGLRETEPKLLSAELAQVPLDARSFVRLEARLAPELGAVPAEPHVVVAIDHSRSMGPGALALAHAAARAYLDHFPAPRVRVLHFARGATWRQPSFVAKRPALEALERVPALENGSAPGAALEQAAAALRAVPGPKRVLLLTDGSLGGAERLRFALRDVPLHVVIVRDRDHVALARNDVHDWATVARETGGVSWDLQGPGASTTPQALADLVKPWVRPVRLENVTWRSEWIDVLGLPDSLELGEGVVVEELVPRGKGSIVLQGEVWSRPIEQVFLPQPGPSRRWAGLLLGSTHAVELSDREDALLAERTRSVSATRSLLAVEPGGGPAGAGGGTFFVGAVGSDFDEPTTLWFRQTDAFTTFEGSWSMELADAVAGGLQLTTLSEQRARESETSARRDELHALVRSLLARCGSAEDGLLVLETTFDEIVGVTVTGAAERARCFEAGAWQAELSGAFDDAEARFEVELRAPRSG